MAFELDHLFICTSFGAPEADGLVDFGLTEGTPNVHPGQGTSNRRFFFHNSMLELVWLHDEREARSELIAPTRLYERCLYRETGASPFGLCFRAATVGTPEIPSYCWEYRPPYMPSGTCMYVADNSTISGEPMLVYFSYHRRPDQYPEERRQPLAHRAGLREITAVRLTVKIERPYSTALGEVEKLNRFSISSGPDHLIELGFDGELQGERADFRPELPLVFTW